MPGYDINGKQCENKICDYHKGKPYTWCYLGWKDTWNYCGQRTVSSETKHTYTGSTCVTPCVMDREGTINRCFDATKEKKECSRTPYTASNNLKCHSLCDSRGGSNDGEPEPFNWCWTSADKSSAWSKCSSLRNALEYNRDNNRKYYFKVSGVDLRLTQSGSLENVFVLVDDQGNSRVTFLEKVERTGNETLFSVDSESDLQRWATECLASWRRNGYKLSQINSIELAMAGTGNFGVNLQQRSRYERNGMEYVDLQLRWTNVSIEITRNMSANYRVIAEVLVPVNVIKHNPELMIDAFLRSVFEHFAIFIGTFNYMP
ncbi:unnamed protein product [Orchesella dallaii]|uniref:Uncharacterized protein n=1 Tax=Orchesella dallaii TaxID=48710 RepID=A0ABP1RUZ2_9HEXA